MGKTVKEVLKEGFQYMGAMIWFFIGMCCVASPFLLGGIGNSKNPETETAIGIGLMIFSPFWAVITKRIVDNTQPKQNGN